MRIRAAAILITAFLIIVMASRYITANDAPHNASHEIYCGDCHADALVGGLLQSPFWGGTDESAYDVICTSCHWETSAPGGGYGRYGPAVKTHSSLNTSNKYGDWMRKCVNCHDPHYQRQKNYKATDASNLYLATGTITSFDTYDSGNNTTTLHYSSITYKSGWNATKLTNKTGDYRRTILFPNVNKLGFNYPVTAVDETAKTIIVSGDATVYLSPGTTFAAMYGQYIKDYIDDTVVWGIMNINVGDGADGAITINTAKNINTDVIANGRSYPDGVNWQITNNVLSGQTTISSGTVIPYGFAVGDEIMIINLKGTSSNYANAGLYEFKTITALPNSTSITVDSNLNNYYDGTTQKIMVQRVPNYTNVTINIGGSFTCNAFDGNKGGVVVFRANGTVAVNTANGITASNKGFRGGAGGVVDGWNIYSGTGGETYNGLGGGGTGGFGGGGTGSPGTTGGVGGGGGGAAAAALYDATWAIGGTGGRGGYGNSGSATGGAGSNGSSFGMNRYGGTGGNGGSYGSTNLSSRLYLGSGGGGGGAAKNDYPANALGGNGGSGGGILCISAGTVTISGAASIPSNGDNGTNGTTVMSGKNNAQGGTGGGGAGGSIAIYAGQINNSGSVSAIGGSGAAGGRTYAVYSSFSGSNPTPNYSSSAGRVITPGSAPFTVQVKFFDQTGTNSFADGYSTYTLADGYVTYNGICELCHSMTNHFRNNGSAPQQNHTNMGYNIAGMNCTACHTHESGFFEASAAGLECLDCHSITQGGRAAITTQFSANSHHIQGAAVTNSQCYQCHWEANADGSVNSTYHEGWSPDTHSATPGAKVDLVIYGTGTRPTTYTVGTTAIQYTANGTRSEIKKINTHCLGCHNAQNNAAAPFGDGKTPKQYAWDGKSIDEKYSQTGTTAWGKYSGGNFTPKNTQTKAYSAHGNAVNNQGGWDLNETWTNTRNGSEIVACFDCHNSHGSTVSGTTTSYTSATTNGAILKDVVANTGGYTMTYRPQAGGSPANKNVYNTGAGICFDCHSSATSGTTPWGYNSTFGSTQAIMGYWDTPYFSPGASRRFGYKATSLLGGGHFGASSTLSSPATHTINGLCTPCHDPHGISPALGADMQYGVPLLKGTWLTSLYKEDRAPANDVPGTYRADKGREGAHYNIDQNTFGSDINSSVTGITQTESQFGGLCLSCHPKNGLTNGTTHDWKSKDRVHESVKGWKTADATMEHNYPCSKCHTPHSNRLPRLMITNCLDSRHKGFMTNNTSPKTSGEGYGNGRLLQVDCGAGMCPAPTWGSWTNNCSVVLGWCQSTPPPEHVCGNYSYRSGSGHKPGNWVSGVCNAPIPSQTVTCHENYDGNQYWNIKTPWAQ